MAHYKAAIQIRNKEMVELSDLIVCYIKNNRGGAYKTMDYATKHEKDIINLAKYEK